MQKWLVRCKLLRHETVLFSAQTKLDVKYDYTKTP